MLTLRFARLQRNYHHYQTNDCNSSALAHFNWLFESKGLPLLQLKLHNYSLCIVSHIFLRNCFDCMTMWIKWIVIFTTKQFKLRDEDINMCLSPIDRKEVTLYSCFVLSLKILCLLYRRMHWHFEKMKFIDLNPLSMWSYKKKNKQKTKNLDRSHLWMPMEIRSKQNFDRKTERNRRRIINKMKKKTPNKYGFFVHRTEMG